MVDRVQKLSAKLGVILKQKNASLAVAEFCTGGQLSAAITSVAGSSEYFVGGCIVYSNQAKQKTLHVQSDTLQTYGAVSAQTAKEMVQGLHTQTGADLCLSKVLLAHLVVRI